jgi:hypothetical protein
MEMLYGNPTRTSITNNLIFVYSKALLSEMLQRRLAIIHVPSALISKHQPPSTRCKTYAVTCHVHSRRYCLVQIYVNRPAAINRIMC